MLSGGADSNRRPLRPKHSALANCATPRAKRVYCIKLKSSSHKAPFLRNLTQVLGLLLLLTACQLTNAAPLPISVKATPTKIVLPTLIPSATATPYHPVTATPAPSVTPTPTATPCAELTGQVIEYVFDSPILGQAVPAEVYLPPCYQDVPVGGYPFLLMLHGQYGHQNTWIDLGLIDAADQLIQQGLIPRMLIVMPYEADMWSDARNSVFTSVLTQDLLPQIEANFPISAETRYRAIGGYSRGANWAVRIGLTQPGLFGAVGGHSYTTFSGDLNLLPGWAADFGEQPYPRFLIDLGDKDRFLQYVVPFEAELNRLNIPHDYWLLSGTHDYPYWEAHVSDYLLWYAEGW